MASTELIPTSSLNLANIKFTQKDVAKNPELKKLWAEKSEEEGKIRAKMTLLQSIPLATNQILSDKDLSEILMAPDPVQNPFGIHAFNVLKVDFSFSATA